MSEGTQAPKPAAASIPFTSIMQDQGSGSDGSMGPQFTWIKSAAAWKRMGYEDWTHNLRDSSEEKRLAKGIDFAAQDVMVFTLGDMGSTGASIKLEKIESGERAVFHLKGTYPDPKLAHGQMITHPSHMVTVPKGLASRDPEFLLNGKKTGYAVHVEE